MDLKRASKVKRNRGRIQKEPARSKGIDVGSGQQIKSSLNKLIEKRSHAGVGTGKGLVFEIWFSRSHVHAQMLRTVRVLEYAGCDRAKFAVENLNRYASGLQP